MQFTQTVLTAVLALASSAAASPLAARQSTLQDFQVSSVVSYSPSGRPGSYPWAQITAEVTDPNEINLGAASSGGSNVTVPAGSQGLNCIAKWYTRGESPLDRTWPCDATPKGYWVMNVLAGSGSFAAGNFNLKFTHVADVLYLGQQYTASFEAEGHFAVGENLAGSCGSSGVCTWSLKDESTPFEIAVTKI
ncbi:hypothetical protein G6011_08013 [Alternaria panax]|uniref:Cell death in tomato 1 n=1 Tax=Alternaria panax TaxID=48097 RepID=A0AAD4F801_9PLEO|nr:hypothetical protein G6011_08013 [Alternaria panax]